MVIQPKWEIEEKAKIFRVWVWFSPAHPPRAVEVIAMRVNKVGLSEEDVSRNSVVGGNFRAVANRRPVVKDVPWRTSGNQK